MHNINSPEAVAERAAMELAKLQAPPPAPKPKDLALSNVLRMLPDDKQRKLAEILSSGYERSPTQERIARLLAENEEGDLLCNCKTPFDVARSGKKFLLECLCENKHPLISGLARWFGVTEQELARRTAAGDAVARELVALMQTLREYADDAALSGDFVPAIAKFHDEARWGLVAAPQQIVVSHRTEIDLMSEQGREIARRMLGQHDAAEAESEDSP
ncbi:MAG: hypothetical protein LBC78_05240 [Oscillospiraceae bacterium]|jgi:hypothetical protein|nr:hypothetical protein [Oscillospiraceae bacterium]